MSAHQPKLPAFAERSQDAVALRVDLGNEPPIEVDGRAHSAQDHRQVSLRWLAGTVLTGLTGAGLIGAAVYAAFDKRSTQVEAPQAAIATHKDLASGETVNQRKGDRLVQAVNLIAAKQTFRTPTIFKLGDKEIVRSRGFTRVSTSLTLASLGFSDEVPNFNPLAIVSDARNPVDPAPDPGPVADNAEVSFVTRDLGKDDSDSLPASLSPEEAQAQVIEQIKSSVSVGNKPALPLPPQMLLMRTSRARQDHEGGLAGSSGLDASPFSSIQVRMVAENVTLLPKAANNPRNAPPAEKLVVVRKGEGLEEVLRANGVAKDQIKAASAAYGSRRADAVSEGKKVKLVFSDMEGDGREQRLARVSVYADETLESQIGLADDGSFQKAAQVAQAVKPARPAPSANDDETDDNSGGMRLYDSLYETALKQDLPKGMVDDLVRIFANDVDFQRGVSGGDSFEAFYTEPEEGETRSDLLYAAITTRNETFHYYRYQLRDEALIDYYDENGRSTRKFLIRTPISGGRLSSPFGYRYHPILGYRKFHSGQDWAAPVGTPIVSAGNGTVIKAAWDSGYGRRTEIQHLNGYITTYNHQSGWARGITEGSRVKQGQLIGYVGQTGLATGPHLHYEVMVNSNFVDPMRVKLARTKEFDGTELASFKRERDRVDGLLAKAPNATGKVADARPK